MFRLFVTLFILAHSNLAANQRPTQKPFTADVSIARFRLDASRNYLEIYYAVAENLLTYQASADRYECALLIHTGITDPDADTTIVNRLLRMPHSVKDTTGLESRQKVIGVLGLAIPKGAFKLRVITADDLNHAHSDTAVFDLSEKSFPEGQLSISDIELASSIRKIPPDQNNIFYKNTFEIIPNPTDIYGLGQPILFYYAESYGLTGGQTGAYQVAAVVYDAQGNETYNRSAAKKKGASSVEVGAINVGGLATGIYDLVLTISDASSSAKAESTRRFYIYNPVVADEAAIVREYGAASVEYIDNEFASALYIARKAEQNQYRSLPDVAAKRRFIYEFWKRRDPSPATPDNAYKTEYLRRVAAADDSYSAGVRAGWKTDRGRVRILYGKPDQVTTYSHEIDTKPYEIWVYEQLQGGISFIFVDRTGFSDYYLVHSDARYEIHNPRWEALLRH